MSGADPAESKSPWLQAGRLAFIAAYTILAIAAARWLFSNIQQVNPSTRAVVVRMGALNRVQSAGLLLAWPKPFERVVLVPAAESVLDRQVQALLRPGQASPPAPTATSETDEDSAPAPVEASANGDAGAGAGYLLTGDAGVVSLDVRVFYTVTSPLDYVLQGSHVLPALDRLVTRSAVTVCASRDLDTILVARPELVGTDSQVAERRERLRSDLVRAINQGLDALKAGNVGLGITVSRVDVQSALPEDAVYAFDAVLTASQTADQGIADARTSATYTMQAASQAADRMLAIAQAQASERVSKAQSDTSSLLQLAQSIRDHTEPELMTRLYRERISQILAKAGSVTLVDPKDDARLIIDGAKQ
ncbi:MAG TPA: protease modulator HflK [Steroidobacteraceae bacterium]|nr:protease modulator HflK [Steroidobacteraceae bacterium]HUA26610.1 protease modulator HflK [Steroidobacteraceae bacterium]